MVTRRVAWCCALATILVTCTEALHYSPVALAGAGDGDCALLLNGPGRTSSYDYSLNLLRGGGFGYNGQHTCITYDAVNAAYLEARKRVQVAQPHGDWKAEDLATVGELLLDISVNLARTYGLSYEDIEKGLPLIDTSKTLIREVCPPFLANVECRPGKYRRFDGLCTNLENPTWGATMQPFTRLIGPLYADGMTAPRISVTGNHLPLARIVSRTMHPDEGFHDHAGTVMVIAWGQFIDHDYTLTATPLDPLNRNDPEECCKRPPHLKNPYCNEIIVPADDYFYRLFNVQCIDFVRGFPAARPGCRLGSRSQYNTLTGVLDANTVYGVTEKFSRKLRAGYGGLLRMNPIFRDYGLKDLLPLKLDIPDEGCTRPNRSMFCFEAGEIRVNEQLVLTCMHTLMAREHNRVAEGLAHVNPHWDDETLFQEARRINIAEVQHITYNEFLPILLGKEVMQKFGLLLQKNGYWDGFDPSVNPNVIDAFAAAAYRFGHSLLPTAVERWSKAHKFIASKRLSDLIRRPYDLYRAGVFDEYFMGLMNQVAQAMDDSITQEVTNHLFKKAGARFGMDLVSFNMQRGREFGLPGYMEFRKFCGLPGAETFDELFGSMPNETIKKYATIFEHPSDVDLWSGGVSERPLPGSMLGPTFACIIATQFSYSRRGDRFWYELPHQPSSFTPEQLAEIRKARLARVICDNTDLIDTIQLYPMVLPDHEINPRVPCRSRVLPSMDFSKWADPVETSFHQAHQPFVKNNANIEVEKANLVPLEIANLVNPPVEHPSQINIKKPCPMFLKNQKKSLKNIKMLSPVILNPKEEPPHLHNRVKRSSEIHNNITLPTTNERVVFNINNNMPVVSYISKTNSSTSALKDNIIASQNLQRSINSPEEINDELMKDSDSSQRNYEILDDDDDGNISEIDEKDDKIEDDKGSSKTNIDGKNKKGDKSEIRNVKRDEIRKKNPHVFNNKVGKTYFYDLNNIRERTVKEENADNENGHLESNKQNDNKLVKDNGRNSEKVINYKTENSDENIYIQRENQQNKDIYNANIHNGVRNLNIEQNPLQVHTRDIKTKSPYRHNERDDIFRYIHSFNKDKSAANKPVNPNNNTESTENIAKGVGNLSFVTDMSKHENKQPDKQNVQEYTPILLNLEDVKRSRPKIVDTVTSVELEETQPNGFHFNNNYQDRSAKQSAEIPINLEEISKDSEQSIKQIADLPKSAEDVTRSSEEKLNSEDLSKLSKEISKSSEETSEPADLEENTQQLTEKQKQNETQTNNASQEAEMDITEKFVKHLISMEELDEIFGFTKPDKYKYSEEKDSSKASFENNNERNKKNDKSKSFSPYLDEILSQQFEVNEKLRSEVVYPHEEDAYEQQRKKALNNYGTHKSEDFTNANKPYEIELGTYFDDEEEIDEEDDVDTGTDKMKVKQDNHNEPAESNVFSMRRNYWKQKPFFIENDKVSSQKIYTYIPIPEESMIHVNEEKEGVKSDGDDEDVYLENEDNNNSQRTKAHVNKEREDVKSNANEDDAKFLENLQNEENSKPQTTKVDSNEKFEQTNKNTDESSENISDVLKKILQKKDSISRHQDMNEDGPKNYETFWALEYKIPK